MIQPIDKPSCLTCPHFHDKSDPKQIGVKIGQCWHSPPTPVALMVGPGKVVMQSHFPAVDKNYVCDQHPERQALLRNQAYEPAHESAVDLDTEEREG